MKKLFVFMYFFVQIAATAPSEGPSDNFTDLALPIVQDDASFYDSEVMARKIKSEDSLRSTLLDGQFAEFADLNKLIIQEPFVPGNMQESGLEDDYYFRRIRFKSEEGYDCRVDQRIRNLNRKLYERPIELTTLGVCYDSQAKSDEKPDGIEVELVAILLVKPILKY